MGRRRTTQKLDEICSDTHFWKGNRKDCDSYRGFSLLNTDYKIYANIIKIKLNKYYDNIIGEEVAFEKEDHVVTDISQW
jgi:hypothetical protein